MPHKLARAALFIAKLPMLPFTAILFVASLYEILVIGYIERWELKTRRKELPDDHNRI